MASVGIELPPRLPQYKARQYAKFRLARLRYLLQLLREGGRDPCEEYQLLYQAERFAWIYCTEVPQKGDLRRQAAERSRAQAREKPRGLHFAESHAPSSRRVRRTKEEILQYGRDYYWAKKGRAYAADVQRRLGEG